MKIHRYLNESLLLGSSTAITSKPLRRVISLYDFIYKVINNLSYPEIVLPLSVLSTDLAEESAMRYRYKKFDLFDAVGLVGNENNCNYNVRSNIDLKNLFLPEQVITDKITRIDTKDMFDLPFYITNKGIDLGLLIASIYSTIGCETFAINLPLYVNGSINSNPAVNPLYCNTFVDGIYNTLESLRQALDDYFDGLYPGKYNVLYESGIFIIKGAAGDRQVIEDYLDSIDVTYINTYVANLNLSIVTKSNNVNYTLAVHTVSRDYILVDWETGYQLIVGTNTFRSLTINWGTAVSRNVKVYSLANNDITSITLYNTTESFDASNLNNLTLFSGQNLTINSCVFYPVLNNVTTFNLSYNNINQSHLPLVNLLNGTYRINNCPNITGAFTNKVGGTFSNIVLNDTGLTSVNLDNCVGTAGSTVNISNMASDFTFSMDNGTSNGTVKFFQLNHSTSAGRYTGVFNPNVVLDTADIYLQSSKVTTITLRTGILRLLWAYSSTTITSINYGSVQFSSADIRTYTNPILTSSVFTNTTGTIARHEFQTCNHTSMNWGNATWSNAYINGSYNANLTAFTTPLGSINYINFRNCNLTAFDIAKNTTTSNASVFLQSNTNLTSFVQPTATAQPISYFLASSTKIVTLSMNNFVFSGTGSYFEFTGNNTVTTINYPTGQLNWFNCSGNKLATINTTSWTWIGSNARFVAGTQKDTGLNLTVNHGSQVYAIRYYHVDYSEVNYFSLGNLTLTNNCDVKIENNSFTAAEGNQWMVLIQSKVPAGNGTGTIRYRPATVFGEINTPLDTSSGGYNGVAAANDLLARGYTIVQ